MVVKKSPRLGLDTWSEGTDLHPNRAEWNAQQLILDDLTAIDVEVPTWDARPQTAVRGTYMWVVDEQRLYRRTATGWQTTARIGGGGRGEVVRVGGPGEAVEGSSPIAARADHTHSIPLATRSTPGAMSAEDKTTLDLHRLPTRNDLVTRSLNSITAEGVYYLDAYSWAITDNGYPSGAQGDRGVLVVYRVSYSSTRVIQEWTASSQRRRWIRSGSGAGDWSTWVELASTSPATTTRDGLLSADDKARLDQLPLHALTAQNITGGSLDSVTNPGVYEVSGTVANRPGNAGGILCVLRGNHSKPVVIQEYHVGISSYGLTGRRMDVYRRFKPGLTGGTVVTQWSPWIREADDETVEQAVAARHSVSGAITRDLDALVEPGAFTARHDSKGLPVFMSWHGETHVTVDRVDEQTVRQTARITGKDVQGATPGGLFTTAHRAQLLRSMRFERWSDTGGSTWSPWQVSGVSPLFPMTVNTSNYETSAAMFGVHFSTANGRSVKHGGFWQVADGEVHCYAQVQCPKDTAGWNLVGRISRHLVPPWEEMSFPSNSNAHYHQVNASFWIREASVGNATLDLQIVSSSGDGNTTAHYSLNAMRWPVETQTSAGSGTATG